MILDNALQLASAYAPTAVATNTNGVWWDTLAAQDWGAGQGQDTFALISINTTVIGNATATLQFKIQGAIDAAFTSPIDVIAAPIAAILQANFATQAVKGIQFPVKFPRGLAYRYYRFAVVIGSATLTAGAFDCWVGPEAAQDNKIYAANYSV